MPTYKKFSDCHPDVKPLWDALKRVPGVAPKWATVDLDEAPLRFGFALEKGVDATSLLGLLTRAISSVVGWSLRVESLDDAGISVVYVLRASSKGDAARYQLSVVADVILASLRDPLRYYSTEVGVKGVWFDQVWIAEGSGEAYKTLAFEKNLAGETRVILSLLSANRMKKVTVERLLKDFRYSCQAGAGRIAEKRLSDQDEEPGLWPDIQPGQHWQKRGDKDKTLHEVLYLMRDSHGTLAYVNISPPDMAIGRSRVTIGDFLNRFCYAGKSEVAPELGQIWRRRTTADHTGYEIVGIDYTARVGVHTVHVNPPLRGLGEESISVQRLQDAFVYKTKAPVPIQVQVHKPEVGQIWQHRWRGTHHEIVDLFPMRNTVKIDPPLGGNTSGKAWIPISELESNFVLLYNAYKPKLSTDFLDLTDGGAKSAVEFEQKSQDCLNYLRMLDEFEAKSKKADLMVGGQIKLHSVWQTKQKDGTLLSLDTEAGRNSLWEIFVVADDGWVGLRKLYGVACPWNFNGKMLKDHFAYIGTISRIEPGTQWREKETGRLYKVREVAPAAQNARVILDPAEGADRHPILHVNPRYFREDFELVEIGGEPCTK